jgi:putative ATP-dependent endonuclease of OLD family
VILVEGVAEQLLVPAIAAQLKRPLAPSGVTVINVDGVAFPPFMDLFGPDKLPYRLAVISDSDRQAADDDTDDEPEEMSARASKLAGRATGGVHIHLAQRTLEWDLAQASNAEIMFAALTQVKPQAGPRIAKELAGADATDVADRLLEYLEKNNLKGRFAQELADLIVEGDHELNVPDYLREAIEWVADKLEEPVA